MSDDLTPLEAVLGLEGRREDAIIFDDSTSDMEADVDLEI